MEHSVRCDFEATVSLMKFVKTFHNVLLSGSTAESCVQHEEAFMLTCDALYGL